MKKSLQDFQSKMPSLYGNNSQIKRQEILEYFLETYELYEKLFQPLNDDTVFYKKSEPTRHPMIFYYGHTAAFFINKLIVSKEIDKHINKEYESMFAIGVDEMSWDDLNDKNYQWPTVDEVKDYRNIVKLTICNLIKTKSLNLPIKWEDPFWWIILMGCEHERIHIETSSVLHRQLDITDVKDDDFWVISSEQSNNYPVNSLVDIKASTITLGKSKKEDFYSWDNEYGKQTSNISDFKVSKYLVSNGEFMEFVNANGYTNRDFWSNEAWEWLQKDKRSFPYFWIKTKNSFKYRTMLKIINMPMNWPVDVNYYEAKAFCHYKSSINGISYRLPTEPEWYALAKKADIAQHFCKGNIALREVASSEPVNKYAFGKLYDVIGNVWQWSETTMNSFEGFKPHFAYDDFSTPTFDGKHNIMKGGSWISTGNESLKSSRFAFRRHFMQHAGFRYVHSDKKLYQNEVDNSYESDALISQYCDFHYGKEYFNIKNLSLSLVEVALKYQNRKKMKYALDLGCAVGRTSFELAKHFNNVTGIDFSANFIQIGTHLKEGKKITYKRCIEGDITDTKSISLKDLGYESSVSNISFLQGDACNLKSHFINFDLIIALNLIDRLYDPTLFLNDIKHRVNSGGLLIIASPYTWLKEFTAKKHWLGGFIKNGKKITTIDSLKQILEDSFDLLDIPLDIPFVIRETARKFQHTITEVTIWQKK